MENGKFRLGGQWSVRRSVSRMFGRSVGQSVRRYSQAGFHGMAGGIVDENLKDTHMYVLCMYIHT